ncbi:MAG: ATP-dependent Clp protease ATP-binding subunit [Deltaproteobacteria bacterium]|nr:ATP-dependent Clp protease ATP-binding subunit [Deltaproteobacteria bacterium]
MPFESFIDEATSLCKRFDTNIIGPMQIITAIVKKQGPEFELFKNATRPHNDVLKDLLKQLRGAPRHEGKGFFIDETLLDVLKISAESKTSEAEMLLSLFHEIKQCLPEDFKNCLGPLVADGNELIDKKLPGKEQPGRCASIAKAGTSAPFVQEARSAESASSAREEKKSSEHARPGLRIPYTINWDEKVIGSFPLALPGRDALIKKTVPVLLRMKDPAAVIIADPGCGRTAFVQALVAQSLTGAVPALKKYRFASLDMPSLLRGVGKQAAGTGAMIDTLHKAAGAEALILIVDDLHLLVAQDGYPMMNDLASCFMPLLAEGSLRAIFTTTTRSYETYFSKDQTFAAHTSAFYMEELSGKPLRLALAQASGALTAFYNLTLHDEALECAAHIVSDKKYTYRPPGSCMRLLDNACALAVANNEQAVTKEQILSANNDVEDASAVLSKALLRSLEVELKRSIYGQDEAINIVANRIRLTKLQLDRKPHRPDGVFLFLGPSGVGKTELAKAVTMCLYNDMRKLIRIDLSEFMEHHEYSKLIGAPPGYVGYGEEGALTGPVAKMGHAVILLDELEKAHQSIINLFLQLFDEGFLTDGRGKRVDFSQCVIIMTSNLGKELVADSQEKESIGFLHAKESSAKKQKPALDYLLKIFSSEFVNRIDDIILFQPLGKTDIYAIAKKFLDDEVGLWKKRGKVVQYTEQVIDFLAEKGYKPELGARHVIRNLEKTVSEPLSHAACQDNWENISSVTISIEPRSESAVFQME